MACLADALRCDEAASCLERRVSARWRLASRWTARRPARDLTNVTHMACAMASAWAMVAIDTVCRAVATASSTLSSGAAPSRARAPSAPPPPGALPRPAASSAASAVAPHSASRCSDRRSPSRAACLLSLMRDRRASATAEPPAPAAEPDRKRRLVRLRPSSLLSQLASSSKSTRPSPSSSMRRLSTRVSARDTLMRSAARRGWSSSSSMAPLQSASKRWKTCRAKA